eukprot:c13612_g1_i1.p1 GENE.c13612_g1_i1~~c13612_g1_i1.p1  ORF type:complete len:116 (+),score=20.78 c13612_g1_i1:39-386(+)
MRLLFCVLLCACLTLASVIPSTEEIPLQNGNLGKAADAIFGSIQDIFSLMGGMTPPPSLNKATVAHVQAGPASELSEVISPDLREGAWLDRFDFRQPPVDVSDYSLFPIHDDEFK